MSAPTIYAHPRTAAFRATLDRLPDEIALAIGLRMFEEDDPTTCVCGWAVREAIAAEVHDDADAVMVPMDGCGYQTVEHCIRRFGGSSDEWEKVFVGVMDFVHAPLIEEALFDRVMAASVQKRPRTPKTGGNPVGSRRGK